MARSQNSLEDFFPHEASISEEMRAFLENLPSQNPEEIPETLARLLKEYNKLLKLTAKLMRLGDSTHNKMERMQEELRETLNLLQKEQDKSQNLLHNILPVPIAKRMQDNEVSIADKFDAVTVLFADIAGFTNMSAMYSPQSVVTMLHNIFTEFDLLLADFGVEKIKTLGDCYMAVAGMPRPTDDHAERIADMSIAMLDIIENFKHDEIGKLELRIGIHTGEVVAGVIGKVKFAYDLWGDTVNTASRMESHGIVGRIHCSDVTYQLLKDLYTFVPRGQIEVKGKGMMNTWFLGHRI